MTDYEYDVFISFPHKEPVMGWVKNHFHELVSQWLPQCMPDEPRIFIDFENIETGAEWPAVLQRCLKTSRCLLPVFCPAYFRSAWCCSELETIRERERQLGLRTPEAPRGLIYPVVFWDGSFFPSHVNTIQWRNVSKWANPYPAFSQTASYSEFLNEVQHICTELSQLIAACPPFRDDWPTLSVPHHLDNSIPLPRVR
jgi:hypothetical protein